MIKGIYKVFITNLPLFVDGNDLKRFNIQLFSLTTKQLEFFGFHKILRKTKFNEAGFHFNDSKGVFFCDINFCFWKVNWYLKWYSRLS
jgi:hypothetical protein